MVRMGSKTDAGYLMLAGITEGNVLRLKNDKPIEATFASFGLNVPGALVIMYAPTEADFEAKFRRDGLIGESTVTTSDPRIDQEAAVRAASDRVLIATVGLPRSGKSTWAKSQAWPVVCPDSIRLALHGQSFAAEAEPFVWAIAKVMVRSLFHSGHRTVILDATNVTRKRRDEWKSREWGLFFRHFPTDPAVCCARAEETYKRELVPVIYRMAREFEPLGEDERRWPA